MERQQQIQLMNKTSPTNIEEPALMRLKSRAMNLHEQGHWCRTSCTATCGTLLMAKGTSSSQITNCFKGKCQCNLPSKEATTLENLQKHQEDIRIQSLLLQKEVSDLLHQPGMAAEAGLNLIEVEEAFPGEMEFRTSKGNMLLETIVYQVLSNQSKGALGIYQGIYDQCMTLFFIFMGISLFFLMLSVGFLVCRRPSSFKIESRVDERWREEQRSERDLQDHYIKMNHSPIHKSHIDMANNLKQKLLQQE